MMPDDTRALTIVVSGKRGSVPGASFAAALNDLIGTLAALDHAASGASSVTVEWDIAKAQTASPLTMELVGNPIAAGDFSAIIIRNCLDGLESLESGAPLPAAFDDSSANHLYRLLRNCGNGISRIQFSSGSRQIATSDEMLSHVPVVSGAEVLKPIRRNHYEIGEIEGRVETVSAHTEYYFNLWETLSGRRVKCRFEQSLRESVRAAWEQRVMVSGRIAFNPDGLPISVDVTGIRVKPAQSSIPQFKDQGIDITGGAESSAYIRGMRDDD